MTDQKLIAQVYPNYQSTEERPINNLDSISGRILSPKHSISRRRVIDAEGVTHDIVIKRKSSLIIPLGAMALSPNPAIFARIMYAHRIFGYSGSHLRDKYVYENINKSFLSFLPHCLTMHKLLGGSRSVIVMEELPEGREVKPGDLCNIIDIITDVHAKYYGNDDIVKQMKLNYYSANDYKRARSTLRAFFDYYHDDTVKIYGEELTKKIQEFIEHMDVDYAETMHHQTLTHNDLTPRNIRISDKEIFIYDWELACYQNPEHDLIELLISTIDDSFTDKNIHNTINYFRTHLTEKTHQQLSDESYKKILRFNALEYCANRLAIYRSYDRHSKDDFIKKCAHNSRRVLEACL